MISKNPLTIYCPYDKKLIDIAIKNNFHKHIVSFDINPFFYVFGDKVITHLQRLRRPRLISEGLRFWYYFLLGKPTFYIQDGNYYKRLIDLFIQREVFFYRPTFFKEREQKRYAVLVYQNKKFFFIKTFTSINEIETHFNIRIKIDKRDYLIKYY